MTAEQRKTAIAKHIGIIRSRACELVGKRTLQKTGKSDSRNIQEILSDLSVAAEAIQSKPAEPVRTLHHLSCTGGTLIAKCIASMANTLVLNEIDMLSQIPFARSHNNFTPTDLVSLLHQSGTIPDDELVFELFANSIRSIRDHYQKLGQTVVLRDHSHGHFLYGSAPRQHPTMRESLRNADIDCLTLVTVRNPVHSYHSMQKMGWHSHLTPSSFDEYCKRYLAFLEAYRDAPIIKYEDFTQRPEGVMKTICEHLEIPFFDGFMNVFATFNFSGDSGRSSAAISVRPTLELPDSLIKEVQESSSYRTLSQILAYPPIETSA